MDGYVWHAEFFQYAPRLQHIQVVKSENVRGIECRLSKARQAFYVIITGYFISLTMKWVFAIDSVSSLLINKLYFGPIFQTKNKNQRLGM